MLVGAGLIIAVGAGLVIAISAAKFREMGKLMGLNDVLE